MPLSNIPGHWRWEDRGERGWWRVLDALDIEDGPHPPPPDIGSKFYDRQGNELDLYNAEELMGDREYKQVAYDAFVLGEQAVEVSTVWLGLDMTFIGSLEFPPRIKIFETMIFGGDLDLEQWRYTTEEEALAGHAEVCKLVQVICEAKRET